MSLLGRPLNYRATRRDARYRRLQSRIYNFLERPRGAAFIYHILVFLLVFIGLVLSVFSTIEEYEKTAGDILVYMESLVCVIFTIELVLRTWSSGCRSRYQGYLGRLKFLRRPFCVIDVITIIASIVVLVLTMRSGGQVLAASALRGLRFFQILRMVRMDRRGGTWKLLGSVVFAHRQELITTLYIGFLGLIFSSFLVFLAEKDVPGTKFSNFAQALWWGVITLCTVGYGDMVPSTWQGKIIASFCSLLGISFFALPAGILGSGFALKVQQQQRQKHMIRRRQPAAMLIQSLWRCYAADEKSMSEATWKIHQIPYSPPVRASSSFRHNASFVGRLSTIRRHRSTMSSSFHSPSLIHNRNVGPKNITTSNENIGSSVANGAKNNLNASYSEDSVSTVNETRVTIENPEEDDEEPQLLQLTSQHKAAIRAIRKMKYFVARKKFREALKPYDVKDVIEQYSSGHADLLNRVKNLQFRLDQILGKQGSKSKDVYASKISLASRVVKVERQVDDVFSKLEQFFEMYVEDRKYFLPPIAYVDGQSYTDFPRSITVSSVSSTPPTSVCQTAIINHWTSSGNVALKPKSILIDKQLSEPNSPITKSFTPPQVVPTALRRPIIQRGYSDLGNRIKKKVTLSSGCSHLSERERPLIASSPVNAGVTLMVPESMSSGPTTSSAIEPSTSAQNTSIGTLVSGSSSIESSANVQNFSMGMDSDTKGSRTITESSELELREADIPEEREVVEQEEEEDGEDNENEEESNETTLLCPTVPNEIIITPSTLNSTSKLEVVTENIYMKNFKTSSNSNFKDV
ncbi:potassium voltage-gated channel subfamily KQT member 1-like [Cylas formicarius]|uniref:potassium voltage-gated channel subfamily KQT member 1-like n=1 Tax=Cylas formicarius TaxID=197179 RepID=UPI00295896EF|nr:potassium voltage-gated channel subfamily KQT member 1-like [Cylas formicarius]XP_060516452.1 potassium voltage-gated channel subfamily KQT member 1-like [Cylas formicarius]